jgi:D-alanine-D-alanine ligase
MRIAVIHNDPTEDHSAAPLDVLDQARAVAKALASRGHAVTQVAATLDLASLQAKLQEAKPDVVFNLLESLAGSDRFHAVGPLLFTAWKLPFTGATSEAMSLSAGKLLAKERLRQAGLPTPDWLTAGNAGSGLGTLGTGLGRLPTQVIIKAIWEHASLGIDDSSVVTVSSETECREQIAAREAKLGHDCFAEEFIAGREFNISILTSGDGCEVLPPAEIDFTQYPKNRPHIVGERAKWALGSEEEVSTPRRFASAAEDHSLFGELSDLCRRSWKLFGLTGYARVDFRVDSGNRPWILEINANPCLAPDAGFAAAVEQAGLSYADAMERIVSAACR